jgi:hypothetical protein
MKNGQRWAQQEFGGAQLGDPRRTARAVELAARVMECPAGTVTAVVQRDAAREAAFRFLRNAHVGVGALGRSSHLATLRRCQGEDIVFVAVDQCSIAVTDRAGKKDFGPVGTRPDAKVRGLQAMTALAISESGRVLGVCGQRWWRRSDEKSPRFGRDQRTAPERESSLWTHVMDDVEDRVLEARSSLKPWYQLDRGGDAGPILLKAVQEQLYLTVRAAYDRTLADDEDDYVRLRAAVSSEKPIARFAHYLRPAAAKKAGHSHLRPRHLEVRVRAVTLRVTHYVPGERKRGEQRQAVDCWAVSLREISPPPGVRRLDWLLLTTYPVRGVRDALKVAWGYCLRWRIEEFHKTWKSGACDLERSQLRSCATLQRWATLLAAVAARIERLKQAARQQPARPALEFASRDEIDGAIVLTERCKWKPGAELTIEQFVLLVANIGGYTGRSSGGPPGSIVIARGLDRVTAAAAAFAAARGTQI